MIDSDNELDAIKELVTDEINQAGKIQRKRMDE